VQSRPLLSAVGVVLFELPLCSEGTRGCRGARVGVCVGAGFASPETQDLCCRFVLGFVPCFLPPVQLRPRKAGSFCGAEQGQPGQQRRWGDREQKPQAVESDRYL